MTSVQTEKKTQVLEVLHVWGPHPRGKPAGVSPQGFGDMLNVGCVYLQCCVHIGEIGCCLLATSLTNAACCRQCPHADAGAHPSRAQNASLIRSSEMCRRGKLTRKLKGPETGQPTAALAKLEEHQDLSLFWE